MSERLITITLRNSADNNRAVTAIIPETDQIQKHIKKYAVQLFGPASHVSRVGLSTPNGDIVTDWETASVAEIVDRYQTNILDVGTPDMLGSALSLAYVSSFSSSHKIIPSKLLNLCVYSVLNISNIC